MASSKTTQLINALDAGLQRYFEGLDREYDSLFANWCEENGFEEDTQVAEEFENDVDESMFTDLLDNIEDFPFPPYDTPKSPDAKRQRFIDILKQIRDDPNCSFSLPEYDGKLFDGLTVSDIEETTEKYQKQCPLLCDRQLLIDYTLLQILAVGIKHNFGYLSMLTDDYARHRLKTFIEEQRDLTVAEWANPDVHPHFKKLKDLEVRLVSSQKNNRMRHHELVKRYGTFLSLFRGHVKDHGSVTLKEIFGEKHVIRCAITSYQKRIARRFEFNTPCKLDNSLEAAVQHIVGATSAVKARLTKQAKLAPLCPFQLDVVIAMGEPYKVPEEDSESDDDDSETENIDDEEEEKYQDHVGDIEAKLKQNQLKYTKTPPLKSDNDRRQFLERYFTGNNADTESLRNHRMIAFVDRRMKKQEEDAFIYSPPENAQHIPNDALPECFIANSMTTILPHDGYGKDIYIEPDSKDPTKHENVGVGFDCGGSMLTLSIHAVQEDVIRAYLYWNGRMMRFLPNDIRDVLPQIFNMEYPGNSEFLRVNDGEELADCIKMLDDTLKDVEFDRFRGQFKAQ